MKNQENENSNPQPKKPQISKRELVFVEHLLGGMPGTKAARKAGFSAETSKHAGTWIREFREDCFKPHLWDYWRKRLDHKLRILDVSSENIIRELALVGFSSIDKFIDFPSKQDAIDDMERDSQIHEIIEQDDESESQKDDENDSKSWKKYRPGATIKLKCIEDIPADLMPAIAEIHETKEGIRIKLHNKLEALDKLARILKLYNDRPVESDAQDFEINIIVNGSKSPLLLSK